MPEAGIEWELRPKIDYSKAVKEAIAQALRKFRDWVNKEFKPPVGRLGKIVPVYEPRYYRPYPRTEGKTEELRESVEVVTDFKGLVNVVWGSGSKGNYASHVRQHGKVRTPGTSANWVHLLKDDLREKLFSLLTIELRKLGVRTTSTMKVPGGVEY